MLKDLEKGNWIIPPWDSRYGKLGHMWKRFNKPIILRDKNISARYPLYVVPKELVVREECRKAVNTSKNHDGYINSHSPYFWDFMELSQQEYYDLVKLKINRVIDRPKCSCRKNNTSFRNVIGGYTESCDIPGCISITQERSTTLRWSEVTIEDKRIILHNLIESSRDYMTQAVASRNKFINAGDRLDKAYFYIATTSDNLFKFGVSTDVSHRAGSMSYKNYKILFESTRQLVADFECELKISLNMTDEYLEFNNLSEFRKYYIDTYKRLIDHHS